MHIALFLLSCISCVFQDSAQFSSPAVAAVTEDLPAPPEVYPPSPFDHVVELELSTEDEVLVDWGPAQWVDEEIAFSGGLHLWAEGDDDVDLALRVENDFADPIGSDLDSGGGNTPYLRLEVKANTVIHIAVAIQDPGSLKAQTNVRLHVVAAPESEATRSVANAAMLAIEKAESLLQVGNHEAARTSLARMIDELRRTEGAHWSDAIANALWQVGFTAYSSGDLGSNQTSWESARAHRERILPRDHSDLLGVRLNVSATMYETGNLKGARELSEVILAAYERTLPEDHPTILIARQNLGGMLATMGELASARALFKGILAARKRTLPEDHPGIISVQHNLAETMEDMGDLVGARDLKERVLAARERTLPEDDPDLLLSQQSLAGTMIRMGEFAEARSLAESLLAGRERTLSEDHPGLLAAQQTLAMTMSGMGDLAGALALEESVLSARERTLPEDHPDLLASRQNYAVTLARTGDFSAARALLESVLAARERTLPEGHPALLAAREGFGAMLLRTGDLVSARALFESALVARERTMSEDDPVLLDARQNLAATMGKMGDLAGALALEQSVLAARERTLTEDHPFLIGTRQNVAVTMKLMGNLAGARALEENVLAARERTLPKDHPDLLDAQQNVASTMCDMGDLVGARALFGEILAARERTLYQDHPFTLIARQNLAATMDRMGDVGGARALFEAVLAASESNLADDHPDLLNLRQNLASAMARMGDLAGARALLGDIVSGMGTRALNASGLSAREAQALIGADSERFSSILLLSEHAEPSIQRVVLELVETRRAVSIAGLRANTLSRDSTRIVELQRAASLAGKELSTVVIRAAQEGLESEAFQRASFERDRAQRELHGALLELGVRIAPVTVDELAAHLPEGSVAVGLLAYDRLTLDETTKQFEGGNPHLLAHVVHSNGSFERIDLGAGDELMRLVEQWRIAIRKPLIRTTSRGAKRGESLGRGSLAGANDEHEVGVALRETLLDPILAAAGGELTRLYLCPDDLAFQVPLEALPLGDGIVGDRIRVRILSSFNDLLAPGPAPETAPSLVALGGADYAAQGKASEPVNLFTLSAPVQRAASGEALPEQFAPLSQTSIEAESIAALFEREFELEPVLLEGEGATKDELVKALAGKRYVHLATHGWFAPETVKSILDEEPGTSRGMSLVTFGAEHRVTGLAPLTLCGLALAGANQEPDALGRRPGILTAQELAGLDLRACELAVLSACETNVGIKRAGQGIQSLQTALHAAGARWAITSLWKVDDAYTRKLMEIFYTYLWIEKLSVPDALWRAKTELRQAGAPLAAWAPWVLSGA